MKRKNGSAIILVLLLTVLGIILTCNLGNVTAEFVGKIYPEYIIQNEDLGSDKVELKDFSFDKKGDIISETIDPWIYVSFAKNNMQRLLFLEIDVASATNEGERVYIYYVDRYKEEIICLNQGTNIFKLPQLEKEDDGLRLDLTAMVNQTIHIDRIVWNNNQYLTEYFCEKIGYCTFFLIMIAFAFVVCSVEKLPDGVHCMTKKRKRDVVFMALLLTLLFTIIGVWIAAFIFFLMALFCSGAYKEKQNCLLWLAYGTLGIRFAYQMSFENIWILHTLSDKVIFLFCLLLISLAAMHCWDIWGSILLFIGAYAYVQYALNDCTIGYFCKYILVNARLALNIMLFIVFLATFKSILGKHFGAFLFHSIFAVYFIANFIKIKFQNALFSKADLKLLREIVGIAEQYINKQYLVIGLMVAVFFLGVCIVYRRKIWTYLKPQPSWQGIWMALVAVIYCWSIIGNCYSEIGIDMQQAYTTQQQQINAVGFAVYTLQEFSGNQKTAAPEGYSPDIVATISNFKDVTTESDVKPTVILILAESLFQVENIPDVTFNKELTTNIAPYKVADTISPSYGGRTAVAEFEALTGLSNLFVDGDTIVYTTYLNKSGSYTGGLAREFKENGYYTCAVHANAASYYSRNMVYENMGFDEFIDKSKFELLDEDVLEDGLTRDEAFVNEIIKLLDDRDEPMFIFGASIEGHSPYMKNSNSSKYKQLDIVTSSNEYDEAVLTELSSYAQTVYNFDKQIGRLIKYFEDNNEPVLIYIFGDHLPALEINKQNGYLDNNWLKYRTPLYAYSNYCDTSIKEEVISTSQIVPEILRKSGISYSAYFDYIYQLRAVYPITQKEFVGDIANEQLNLYNQIEWDLLHGERYLLSE